MEGIQGPALPSRKTARLAGALYLLVVLMGPFTLLYVPGKLYVPGDASASVRNILAHSGLFQANIVVGLVSELTFIAVVLTLYQLLKGVHAQAAAAMALLILLDAPLAFMGIANEAATLRILRGADSLRIFDAPQRDALAMLLIDFDRNGVLVSQVFWGLWLLPLGWLVYRSRFLPRLLGVWLFVNGLAYVALSAIGVLAPQHLGRATTFATPVLFGEVALMLWLLVVGVRPRAPAAAAPASG